MIDGITREDVADGEYDDEITLAEVKRDIDKNFFGSFYACWIDGENRALEIGHVDGALSEDEPPIITNKPSEVYQWLQC